MKYRLRKIIGIMLIAALASGCANSAKKEAKSAETKKTEVITIWNYYNGPQKESFDKLVEEFNETVGAEKKIFVESVSKGSLDGLIENLSESANEQIGSEKLPQLTSAYRDTALELDEKGLIADIRPYLTKEEAASYVEGYLQEGDFSGDGSLKIFPVAKSTEVLTLNHTVWEAFAKDTKAKLSDLNTWEGIAKTAELYYKWTDEQTKAPNDGKAFFGRDSVSNYMLSGSSQLGHDIITVKNGKTVIDFDKKIMKKLWDFYYLPYIKGYYTAEGKFRSDDMKLGNLIAYVGSTSGALYTPEKVVYEDGSSEEIKCQLFPAPNFAGTEPLLIQQGGGMVLMEGEEHTKKAAVEFLKWFTDKEVNTEFCIGSGYLPVKKEANNYEFMEDVINRQKQEISPILRETLLLAVEEVNQNALYVSQTASGGNDIRKILDNTIAEYAKADREKVKQMTADGFGAEEAVKELKPDMRFEKWYKETYDKIKEFSE